MKIYLDIAEFDFSKDSIGIQLEINENVCKNPIKIFKQIWWSDEIFASSVNEYGYNMSL